MSPSGKRKPTGQMLRQIEQSFESYDAFKSQFSAAAKQVEGVGWAILVWAPRSQRLEILQAERHQFLSQWDVIPLLALDVWEHAYYLQYLNEKATYVDRWWNVVDWHEPEARLKQAQQVKWTPFNNATPCRHSLIWSSFSLHNIIISTERMGCFFRKFI